jgi:hypothetical protein
LLKGPAVRGVSDYPFDVLRSLLTSAARMAQELLNDPLFARLLSVFERMPEGDRETVVGALEREVQTRLLSQEVAGDLSQVELRPNPHAQLYFRVVEPAQQNQVEMVAFLRTANSLQRGIDSLDPHWRDLVRQALRQLDPAGLEKLHTFNRSMQEIIDGVMAEASSSQNGAEPPEEPVRPVVTKGIGSGGT